MKPVNFKGATFVQKPKEMSDKQCSDAFVVAGYDSNGQQRQPFILTAWQPSHEDIMAILRGEPVWVKTITKQVQPMVLFTQDKKGNQNL